MKKKLINWIRQQIWRCVEWALTERFAYLATAIHTEMHHVRDNLAKANAVQWRLLNSKIAALQAIDVPLDRDAGKIVILARVGGRDVVKFIDIRPDMPISKFKDMVRETEALYGASPKFIDAPPGALAHLVADLKVRPDAQARKRERGYL